MASTQVRRQPPPPPPDVPDRAMRDWLQRLNRWFLDLSAIISTSGGIDPGQISGNVILNGNGPPNNADGSDGDLYLNNTGTNGVLRLGLAGEGTSVRDLSGNQLYGKVAGAWEVLV